MNIVFQTDHGVPHHNYSALPLCRKNDPMNDASTWDTDVLPNQRVLESIKIKIQIRLYAYRKYGAIQIQ